jgi:hypothetical protein
MVLSHPGTAIWACVLRGRSRTEVQ